jgi:uncharacterized protein
MIALNEIKDIASRIAETTHAERIVLFGSYADGAPTTDSDVDLLVIAPSNLPAHKRSQEIYRSIRPQQFPMDILVYTPDEVNRSLRTPVSFISHIMNRGKTVYVRGA